MRRLQRERCRCGLAEIYSISSEKRERKGLTECNVVVVWLQDNQSHQKIERKGVEIVFGFDFLDLMWFG